MRKEENGKLQQVICNGCGYFSRKDGLRHRFDLCEDCYDKWIHTFAVPVEEMPETELL